MEPNDYVKAILDRNQIPFNHKARQITVNDFQNFNFIFGMDRYNIYELSRYANSVGSQVEIVLLGEFYSDDDKVIADPYFDNRPEDFEKCFIQISQSCDSLLQHLLSRVD